MALPDLRELRRARRVRDVWRVVTPDRSRLNRWCDISALNGQLQSVVTRAGR
jgi:hypothetical protein